MLRLVEKKNHNALHALFDIRERAERHLREVIPDYVKRGLFSDKTLRADSFEIIESQNSHGERK
jgi:hypothetical protein